jgi:hypothetical membrane protein
VSYPARTLFVFACYLVLLGLVLLIAPNSLLGAFRIEPTSEVWIRVVGLLAMCLGTYYTVAARHEFRPLFVWSIPVRATVTLAFGAFVAGGLAPPALVLFGAVDLLGALWTWTALRGQAVTRS